MLALLNYSAVWTYADMDGFSNEVDNVERCQDRDVAR
jgi:hypothetical protein